MLMSSNRHIFLIKRPIHGLLGHNNNVMNNVWPVEASGVLVDGEERWVLDELPAER